MNLSALFGQGLGQALMETYLGAMAQGTQGQVIKALITLMANHDGVDELKSLLLDFEKNGMGDAVQSWLGVGANTPITAEAVEQAIGQQRLQKIAETAYLTIPETAENLAIVLPELINKVSRDGELNAPLIQQVLDVFTHKNAA